MTNVLLIYEQFTPSVKLCAFEQLNYLSQTGSLRLTHSCVGKLSKKLCMLCDVVVFVRSTSILEMMLAKEFKKQGKLLIYVLDDDLLNVPNNMFSSDFYRYPKIIKRISDMMNLCDILLTPSILLAEKYQTYFTKTVTVEEPCVAKAIVNRRKNEILKIGFAGSLDRAGDINLLISEAIRALINKYGKKISIEFMGALPQVADELGLQHYPYEDNYDSYKKKLDKLNWDIGLAPMPDTEFHRYKHYNKYVEYSSSLITGVYSNVQPYTRVIKEKVNGLLCDNTKEAWVEAVSWLIDHPEETERIRLYNSHHIQESFSTKVIAERLLQELPELGSYCAKKCKCFPLKYIMVISLTWKTFEFIVKYGLRAPKVAIYKLQAIINKI